MIVPVKSDPTISAIAKALGYRKHKAGLTVTPSMQLCDLNWSGGSISRYCAVRLADMEVSDTGAMNMAPPWANPAEGATVEIPKGVVIVRTGVFMGKPGLMTIYVRPDDAAPLLPDLKKNGS